MAYPPTDIDPVDLFQRLIERPAPSEVVPYPSDDVDFNIRIMGMGAEDIEPLTIKARRWVKDTYKVSDSDLETTVIDLRVQNRTACEILAKAIHYENPIPGSEATEHGTRYPLLFHGKPENVAKLPPREIGVLWALWNLVQNRIAPSENNLSSPEQVRAWVKVLTDGARPFGFFQLDLPQQEALLTSLLSWAQCLLELLSSLPENLPTNLESTLESYGFGIPWCTGLAVSSIDSSSQSQSPSSADDDETEDETMSAEEAEARARDMLRHARRMADEGRE